MTTFLTPPLSGQLGRCTASWNFSQTRGTAKKTVGWQSRRSSATVARLRANHVSPPTAIGAKSLIMRSAMWLSGRNDRSRSPSRICNSDTEQRIVHMMLAWVIIAPLGGPVVPLVYTSVAIWSADTAPARASNSPGSRWRRAAPTARSSPKSTMYGSSMRPPFSKTTMRSSFGRRSFTARILAEELLVLDEAHPSVGVAEDVGHLLGELVW